MTIKTLTELIMESCSPWDNPYQGTDKKVLFVCSAGILRSATGARIYAKKYNTRCAGSEVYALIPLLPDLVIWADEIVFVNKENFESAKEHIDFEGKDVKVLDIPDQYRHMDPRLIAAFEEQYEPL
jgi:predicted protein tyrosine phosphatase